jgi:hypothetical protein
MEDTTDEASIPRDNASNNGKVIRVERMNEVMVRKFGTRTFPWSNAAETNITFPSSSFPLQLQDEDEDVPVAKRPRLWAPTADRISTATGAGADSYPDCSDERSITDPATDAGSIAEEDEDYEYEQSSADAAIPDVAPTHALTMAASLPKLYLDAVVVPGQKKKKHKWTPVEDVLLTEAVKKHGINWVRIAALVPGRTNWQCRQRVDTLNPANGGNRSKGRWTPEKDTLLTLATVAALIPGQTHEKSHDKWVKSLDMADKEGLGKGKWTPEEDALLTEAVKKYGANWGPIAALVPGRTRGQCSSRWTRQLDPTSWNNGRWTPEEDAILRNAIGKVGKAWAAVADLVPGRNNIDCRDRWVRRLDIAGRKHFEKGAWTLEEDAKLTEAVQKHGTRHWKVVAALVCTRSNRQCHQHWMDHCTESAEEERATRDGE